MAMTWFVCSFKLTVTCFVSCDPDTVMLRCVISYYYCLYGISCWFRLKQGYHLRATVGTRVIFISRELWNLNSIRIIQNITSPEKNMDNNRWFLSAIQMLIVYHELDRLNDTNLQNGTTHWLHQNFAKIIKCLLLRSIECVSVITMVMTSMLRYIITQHWVDHLPMETTEQCLQCV